MTPPGSAAAAAGAPFDARRHGYAVLCAAVTVLLLAAGGLVTSTGSGLAVPDWPLSHGQVLPPMTGGVLYEHGHRLVAALVGCLTVALAVWFARREPRPWVRRLAWLALGMVVLQGLLGGITVLLGLPLAVSVTHACLAQVFFVILVLLALATGSRFLAPPAPLAEAVRPPLRILAAGATALVFAQLVLGAVMRHTGAGLAIPDFPLALGRVVPPLVSFEIAVHFAHRAGAVAAAAAVFWALARVWRRHPGRRDLARPALAAAILVVVQSGLGGWAVLTRLDVLPATLHVVNGALLLAAGAVLTARAWRAARAPGGAAADRGAAPRPGMGRRVADYLELTKPRVTALVLVTTAAGFHLASRGGTDLLLLLHALIGTLCVAAGTSALNQWLERRADGRMLRTRMRPLPAGRLGSRPALLFGAGISALGLAHLALAVNGLTAVLAAATLLSYIGVYTPLKKVTPLATLVGAIPGALPPLIGWTAARGVIEPAGLALFAILFVWQLPHSLAIALMYRDDYARGGFRLLPVVDPEGGSTGRQILAHSLLLLPVSLVPAAAGLAGTVYLGGALLLGLGLIGCALPLMARASAGAARRVLLASIVYLPVLLGLLVLDRTASPLP
jgi:protoheme IX farnesyltransferase